VVDEIGVRDEARACGVSPATDLDRLLDEPWRGIRQYGAPAQRLLDGRRQVGIVVVAFELLAQPAKGLR